MKYRQNQDLVWLFLNSSGEQTVQKLWLDTIYSWVWEKSISFSSIIMRKRAKALLKYMEYKCNGGKKDVEVWNIRNLMI